MKPYPFQRKDLDTLRANDYTALVNIEPGGGKTPLSTFAINESGSAVTLIVAPLNTHKSAWIKTSEQVLDEPARVIGNSNKRLKQAFLDFEMGFPGTYLISPQLFTRANIEDWRADLVIVDEIHNINKPKGKGQQQLDRLAQRSGARLALSGTPARRDFTRNWSNMRFEWPELYERGQVAHDNFYLWCRDRMIGEEVYTNQRDFNGRPKKVTQWLAEENPGQLYNEAPCVIQHFRRRECCEFHPNGFLDVEEPQRIERVIELHPKQKKAINSMETKYLAWLNDNPLIAELTITQQQRIRQFCLGVPTVTYTTEEVEDDLGFVEEVEKVHVDFAPGCESPFLDEVLNILGNLDDGEPVVVYLESQKFAREVTRRLNEAGYVAEEYSGKTTKTREDALARFGKDVQVIVGVITAIGTGTDGLQHISNTEIWIERSVDDTQNEQTENRQDRLGVKAQVQRYVITDDLGYADGRMSDQIEKRIRINESNRRMVL